MLMITLCHISRINVDLQGNINTVVRHVLMLNTARNGVNPVIVRQVMDVDTVTHAPSNSFILKYISLLSAMMCNRPATAPEDCSVPSPMLNVNIIFY